MTREIEFRKKYPFDYMFEWTKLKKVGFWKNSENSESPEPEDLQHNEEMKNVYFYVSYLETFIGYVRYRGFSKCRICGQMLGSSDYTDGVYCWPQGFEHYLLEHKLHLPKEFKRHVEEQMKLRGWKEE